jgi:amino acid adenylation domain-containing protein
MNTSCDLQNFYPITDIQRGIIFDVLRNEYTFPTYVVQTIFHIKTRFYETEFLKAFARVINRYYQLNSAFVYNKSNHEYCQYFYRDIKIPCLSYDYRDMMAAEKNSKFSLFIEEDAKNEFLLHHPPLMRLTIFKFSDNDYRIVWTRHHVLLDGESVKIIVDELFSFYRSILAGEKYRFRKLSNYNAIQARLMKNDSDDHQHYWSDIFSHCNNPAYLPETTIKNNNKTFSKISSKISGDQYYQLRKFIDLNQLTMNTLLEASWAITLFHYSNNSNVVFGSVRAYPRHSINYCVGLFMNTLPVPISINTAIRVINFLREIREKNIRLKKYLSTSLTKIKEFCCLSAEQPLYQSVIDYKPESLNKFVRKKFPELSMSTELRLNIPYPIMVEVIGEEDTLKLEFHYDTSLFSTDYATLILDHFVQLIHLLPRSEEDKIADLPIVSSKDWKKLQLWNKTEQVFPIDSTIHQLFDQQTIKTPTAKALVYGDQYLTYQQLNNRANQLAHDLIQIGVEVGSFVAICLYSGIDMIVAILAVLKVGGIYIPVDANYPEERIKFLLDDSAPKIVITNSQKIELYSKKLDFRLGLGVEKRAPGVYTLVHEDASDEDNNAENSSAKSILKNNVENARTQSIFLNMDEIIWYNKIIENPNTSVHSENGMYVIYTSGSTGIPKGVLVEHRSAINMAFSCINTLEITNASRILQIASFSFDVFVAEWCMTLLAGATLYLMDKNIFSADTIVQKLRDYQISTIILASTILSVLPKTDLPALKVIACGGEPCSLATINFWTRNRLFLNIFGVTEASVCSTSAVFQSGYCDPHVIGRPLANIQIHILNENQNIVPIGVSGEMCISGIGLARQYHNNPLLTQEKFVRKILIDADGNRKESILYRTGDLARWLPEGQLEFIGRKDEQVKIRGFRIEIGEIERTLERYPLIVKAIVLIRLVLDNKQLLAYVFTEGKSIDLAKVKHFVKEQLPSYMIPSRMTLIEQVPLTANGKIDKEKLLTLEDQQEFSSKPELSEQDRKIVDIIRSILQINFVSPIMNFFDLGFDSISLIQFSNKLSRKFNKNINVIDLFTYTTVQDISNHISNLKRNSPHQSRAQRGIS